MRISSLTLIVVVGMFFISGVKTEGKQTSSATAYYKDASNNCISLTVQTGTPFKAKGASDCEAYTQAANCSIVALYYNSACTTQAAFVK